MIKERNIYKAWVSIQKLTKHTMNLMFMYFKELLNAHTKNAIHHSFYYIHIWITARLGIILAHCVKFLKNTKNIHHSINFLKTCLQHYPDRFFRSVPKLLYYVLQSVSIICIPKYVHCNIIYRPCYKKKNQKIDHIVLSWVFNALTYLSECVLVHLLMPRVVILFNKTEILVTFSLQSWLPSVHTGWKVTLTTK